VGQPEPKKSKVGLYVGVGCGCLLLLACIGGGLAYWAISGIGPGEEVVSQQLVPGQPFTLSYVQDGSQKYEAWLEVDVNHSTGYNLSGQVLLNENGTPFGQYTLAESGSGSPITPVEKGSTDSALTPARLATDSVQARAAIMPSCPVPAFALPVLTRR